MAHPCLAPHNPRGLLRGIDTRTGVTKDTARLHVPKAGFFCPRLCAGKNTTGGISDCLCIRLSDGKPRLSIL